MKDLDDRNDVILEQALALDSYLQALLTPKIIEQEVPPQIEVVSTTKLPKPLLSVVSPTQVAPPSLKIVTPNSIEDEATSPIADEPQQSDNDGVPSWAQSRFESLLFNVSGLTMAVPLIKLDGVLVWKPDLVTAMPASESWFLGIMNYQNKKVKLIDVADLIMPGKRDKSESQLMSRILLVGNGEWGLVFNAVIEVLVLEKTGVKWRSIRGKRPWLAGMVIEKMCALMDVDAFIDDLQRVEH